MEKESRPFSYIFPYFYFAFPFHFETSNVRFSCFAFISSLRLIQLNSFLLPSSTQENLYAPYMIIRIWKGYSKNQGGWAGYSGAIYVYLERAIYRLRLILCEDVMEIPVLPIFLFLFSFFFSNSHSSEVL